MRLHKNRTLASLNLAVVLSMIGASVLVSGQTDVRTPPAEPSRSQIGQAIALPSDVPTAQNTSQPGSSGPFIAPGDEIDVMVYDAPDLSIHSSVGPDGTISFPLIGH